MSYNECSCIRTYRTTRKGGLPNTTYFSCKPIPLGSEFECFVDAITKIILYLEMYEGKVRMIKRPYLNN